MAHRILIGGTTYEIAGGKTLVNGSGYNIASGKTLVNGTAYNISFGTPAGSLAVGSSLYFNVDGVKKEFLVVNQGIPSSSSRYDSSCDGTWVLMKNIYTTTRWDSSNNDYENSNVHAYSNGTFLGLFDSDIQAAIKQIKLPYRKGTGSGGSTQTGANGLSTKVFLLSGYEVGWTTTISYLPVDGAKLSYFNSGTGTTANNKRISRYNGFVTDWWTRSPNTSNAKNVWSVSTKGEPYSDLYNYSNGVRPAFVLPSNFDITNYLS